MMGGELRMGRMMRGLRMGRMMGGELRMGRMMGGELRMGRMMRGLRMGRMMGELRMGQFRQFFFPFRFYITNVRIAIIVTLTFTSKKWVLMFICHPIFSRSMNFVFKHLRELSYKF
jgi:hypothetical protein